ncbi:MAG: cupin domain-containing protein [Kiritimatiellae bacterium]|jgi:mannose-6-phosphate isomerase-like protein (cupin superfamily)|nr:cupin domain-containing protein [Lentisphaerota bacterium]MBO4709609.1 cupin domain-containing protein [Kiritimatiellia bacterium]MBQ3748371.1 cupin domain-containing protein [Kiritimatiellia bacterium]MBQ6246090.1 cupin domain-containing protein [Kiritimatiellia bacterium]MBQ6327697.1 cupin domain-containing protein [Kiritimatiellia bacterium]
MKEIKTTADITNATAIDLGPLAEIKDYVLELGPDVKIPGKVFGGTAVKAGGADFSLQVFAPGTEGGFYHTHKEHEELYFFLSGEGEYQVDGTNIPVKEGSVVRVSPAGKRAVRNTGSTPLTMLCVQYRAAAPGSVTPADGTILADPVKW